MIYSFGRKPTLLIFGLAHFYLSSLIPVCPSAIARCLCARVPSGFFASESFSPMGAFLTELFSTRLRGRGQGFSYNVGCALGAISPAMAGYLSTRYGAKSAIRVFATTAYLAIVLRTFCLPETRKRELQVDG